MRIDERVDQSFPLGDVGDLVRRLNDNQKSLPFKVVADRANAGALELQVKPAADGLPETKADAPPGAAVPPGPPGAPPTRPAGD